MEVIQNQKEETKTHTQRMFCRTPQGHDADNITVSGTKACTELKAAALTT